jgi:uncharacterized protein (DUF2147 family)
LTIKLKELLSIQKHMKRQIIFSLFLFTNLTLFAQTKASAILGIWETEAKDGKMELYQCGNSYCGKLLKGADIINPDGSSKKDVKNPDPQLRSRDLVGIEILTGLSFDGKEYQNGRIYNGANGKTYKCYVWLKNDVLHLRGYLGLRAFGQTSKWNRIK